MLGAGVPPEQQQHVHEGFRQVAGLAVAIAFSAGGRVGPAEWEDGESTLVAVSLGQFSVAGGLEDEGQVGKRRGRPAEGAVEQLVQGGTGEPLLAADDVADVHQVVVHHVGEVVRGQAVGLHQHLVVEDGGVDGDGAADGVCKGHGLARRHLEAHNTGRTIGFQLGDFIGVQ